jgi:hypothetical protein
MSRHARVVAAALVCGLLFAAPAFARRGRPPDWLQRLLAERPEAQVSAAAVVLLDEDVVSVEPDGTIKETVRYAVRVRSREGREAAAVSAIYLTDSGRVRDMHAWLISQSGSSRDYDKNSSIDVSLVGNDVYNEVREKSLSAAGDAEAGAVFGAEVTSESRQPFGQFEWMLNRQYPVSRARRVLRLPAGWGAKSVTFNHAPIEPSVTGSTYTWEASNLPGIELEPLSPTYAGIAARIAVTCDAPPGGPWPAMSDWPDVSRWLLSLTEKQVTSSDALASKARELVAGGKSEIQRIRAIGKYVQAVSYISIQTGIGRGGGFQPRPAAEVFARNYGDCKGKATLMRAMLAAAGIESYSVSVFGGDRTYVHDEWPSPQQFNHAIVAVVLKEPLEAPAVVNHPSLGRLLFFDPTQEETPVGHLPADEQGSLALVVASDGGALLRMPLTGPEGNSVERQVEGSLSADGTFSASVREKSLGESAAYMRAIRRQSSPTQYRESLERRLVRASRTAKVGRIDTQDARDEASFEIQIDYVSDGYAQLVQDGLLVFRPPDYDVGQFPELTTGARRYPAVVEASQTVETFRITVPAGYEVDELPEAAEINSEFGRLKTSWRADGTSVVGERTLQFENCAVPVENYSALKQFVDRARAAWDSALVLARTRSLQWPPPRGARTSRSEGR